MKNRILSLLLAAALVLCLCACSAKYLPADITAPAGETAAASIQPAKPAAGASASPAPADASGADISAAGGGFQRARLWDATLDAVVADFAAATGRAILGGDENAVYSPVGVYLALGAVTEGAGGDTYTQLMDVLGAASPGDAIPYREVDDFFWYASGYTGFSYQGEEAEEPDEAADGGAWTPALSAAASVWLGEGRAFRESFVASGAVNWYADVFDEVSFGTAAADEQFNTWMSGATEGRWTQRYEAGGETALLAASAVYLRDGWLDKFSPQATQTGVFTRADGQTVEVPFMNRTNTNTGYYQAETYTQTVLFLSGGAEMHLVLPAEGVALAELLASPQALSDMLRHNYGKYGDIRVSLPRFAFASSPPVAGGVQALGAVNAFDPARADFTALLDKDSNFEGLYLADLVHAAYIGVNENGVEAAPAAEAGAGADAGGGEGLPFVLDKPFLFFIRCQGMPLLVGVVNNPAA